MRPPSHERKRTRYSNEKTRTPVTHRWMGQPPETPRAQGLLWHLQSWLQSRWAEQSGLRSPRKRRAFSSSVHSSEPLLGALGIRRRVGGSSGDQSQMQHTDMSQGVNDAALRPGNSGWPSPPRQPPLPGADIHSAKLGPALPWSQTSPARQAQVLSEPTSLKPPKQATQGPWSPTRPSPLPSVPLNIKGEELLPAEQIETQSH